ncbi:MAG: hypothetical protein CMF62_03900 [Magnetococcales bacterium]|nr:hypothetical protein [Magnetococcales bacterium]
MKNVEKYTSNDFLIIHEAFSMEKNGFDTLVKILEDKYIKLGKDVEPKYRKLGGEENEGEHIFSLIYVDEVKDKMHTANFGLIIDPKILYERNFYFNRGWQGCIMEKSIKGTIVKKSIMGLKTDSDYKINKKINKILKYIKHPTGVPEIFKRCHFSNHELLFDEKIPLDKYVIGITCTGCDEKGIQKINNIIKNKNYQFPIIRRYDEIKKSIGV